MLAVALLSALLIGAGAMHGASPTPEPGGANQATGIEGPLNGTLFNGQVRIRKMTLGPTNGSPEESYADTSSARWVVFRSVMSNGTKNVLNLQQFTASIVDADGITIDAQPDKVRPAGMVANVPPGGAWQETILFNIPVNFKPTKIVLVPADRHYKAFRIALPASP